MDILDQRIKNMKLYPSKLDFSNTEIAFRSKSDAELKKTSRLFSLMNKAGLVKIGSKIGLIAFKLRVPFVETIIRNTIYEQFCGGRTLLETQSTIDLLAKYDTLTILDYGVEGKESMEDFNRAMNEFLKAIDFTATNASVPVISIKITGMCRNDLLEKLSKGENLSEKEGQEKTNLLKRLDAVCHRANVMKVGVFVDAEESWIQRAIDELTDTMMERYNKEKVIVYNTFQMYRKDRLEFLKTSHQKALSAKYLLGAKLVRGAYMEKEAKRAAENGYENPIHKSKADTDKMYNDGIVYCIENYTTIASCAATHNAVSCELQAQMIEDKKIDPKHPHLSFCQLYGMSDNITFNLAAAGYNSAKYVPYGPVADVIPYLIRRAQENAAVSGEMSRELKLIKEEILRRKSN